MHELAISEAIVSEVCDRVEGQVVRVVLEIGQLSALMPDSLRFCFEVAARGTRLEGAALEIMEIPGMARCRACAAPVTLGASHIGTCSSCGGIDLEVVSGQELRIRAVEIN
jgi:hydrogenase nickel incorporation protein HypA/HybF